MNTMNRNGLLPAWADSVHDAQSTFRCVLKAMSEPGQIQTMPTQVTGPVPLNASTTALCLALTDHETPVWLDRHANIDNVQLYLRFHCGCPLTIDRAAAAFAVITNIHEEVALDGFAQGSAEYPDRSTTLLIQVPSLQSGPLRQLSGPGIPATHTLRVDGLPVYFDAWWRANTAGFPLGVDIVFCSGNQIVGMPRTTQLHV